MSEKLQDIKSIAPMADGSGAAGDPIDEEYNNGKRMLENKNFGEAAVAFHNALVGYEEKGDDNGIANACNQLGLLCMEREDYEAAVSHFSRAREICEKLGDPISVFALSKTFIDVYVGLKDYGRAIEACLDILDAYHANNDPRGAVVVMEKMSDIYILNGERGKAADVNRTIASIHRNFNHPSLAESFEKKAMEIQAGS